MNISLCHKLVEVKVGLASDCLLIFQVVNQMVAEIANVRGVSRVLYDLTAKPPGTTEWE